MTNLHDHGPASFEDWCKLSGLDRHYVRRNYSALRQRYEADPLTPMPSLPPPAVKQRDRYDEL
ncbi:hypothetical protein [Sphingopyxis sp. 113P3]|uniref:hypothetical protein n=1 Tax=Sphingopyxis sp. (strain 113P3) TaxID=292913 RepID=UPI0006AD27E7|nr:hypothetical protein [Sphingopyxis sp. 113P3]ALC13824.1 hypothetical protein LH20_17850 [Sphingopyxis sp. 113P3]